MLLLRERGVRPADSAEDAQLAAELQVLPLVALHPGRHPLHLHHVHGQLVLRTHRRGHLLGHLQIHRVSGVSVCVSLFGVMTTCINEFYIYLFHFHCST